MFNAKRKSNKQKTEWMCNKRIFELNFRFLSAPEKFMQPHTGGENLLSLSLVTDEGRDRGLRREMISYQDNREKRMRETLKFNYTFIYI